MQIGSALTGNGNDAFNHMGDRKMMDAKERNKRFDSYEMDEDKKIRCLHIRNAVKQLAYVIDNVCPDGREKSLALTRLEEAVMWANKSVSRMDEWADQYKE